MRRKIRWKIRLETRNCGQVLHENSPTVHREGENRETAVKNGTFEAASMKRGSGILSVHDI